MIQIEIQMPMHRGAFTVSETAEQEFAELEDWFREMGTVIHRLMYMEIPCPGFGAAYSVTVRDGMFDLLVYIEDHDLATLAKLRWGGRFV